MPENTKKATLKWVTVFNEYLAEKGIGFDFGTGGAEELSLILSQTYKELRQKNGEPYSKSSLLGFRAAIQRHLRQLHRDINIFDDREFTTANEILDAQLKKQKREGDLKPVKHKEPLTDGDFSKLMQYFRTHEDPVSLTEKVWFYITYHFCLRASESQAMLRVEDFEEKHDEQEQPYFVLSTSFTSKNHQGGMTSVRDTVSEGRIQAPSQVAAMKLLFSNLDKSDRIFQMAKKSYSSEGKWYTVCQIGKNTISAMMKRLSTKARLSKVYTNHCVRATCITRLTAQGVDPQSILGTSGHRSVQSLCTYNRSSDQAKAKTAARLDVDNPPPAPVPSEASAKAKTAARLDVENPPPAPVPSEASADFDDIDEYLRQASTTDLMELEQGKPVTSLPRPSRNREQQHVQPMNFAQANFSGCTFNITINPF